jgi:hypothetical protein
MNVKGEVDHKNCLKSSKLSKKLTNNRSANRSNFAEKEHMRNL